MKSNKLTAMMIESIAIPTQPDILIAYLEELNKNMPDMLKITAIIQQDMAISASILNTVNSVAFNLSNKVSSIQQAIILLGLTNLTNLVYCFTLRKTHSNTSPEMNTFWEQTTHIAYIAAYISQQLTPLAPDEAFSVALLSNCGVPPLAEQLGQTYLTGYLAHAFDETTTVTDFEDKNYMLDHSVIGYHLGKKWNFSTFLTHSIYLHHTTSIKEDTLTIQEVNIRGKVALGISILQCAEHIYCKTHDLPPSYQWNRNKKSILTYLKTNETILDRLIENLPDLLPVQ